MAKDPSDSATVTRKPDDKVGTSGSPPAGGGRQTAEQAAITRMGAEGKDDAARRESWGKGDTGASPPALGGSSGGHSDQIASRGPDAGRKVAHGHAQAEKGNE